MDGRDRFDITRQASPFIGKGYNDEEWNLRGVPSMVLLKCPKCGRSAELPDDLVGEDHWCYVCHVGLEIADPTFIPRREMEWKGQLQSLVLGAMLGGCSILSIGVLGGDIGLAVATGVAGALLGCIWGFVDGLVGGIEWAALTWDGSWLTFWAKVNMVLGGVGGFWLGIFGVLRIREGPGVTIGLGVLGGLILGALL